MRHANVNTPYTRLTSRALDKKTLRVIHPTLDYQGLWKRNANVNTPNTGLTSRALDEKR